MDQMTGGILKVMDRTGHTSVKWDPSSSEETRVARETFANMIGQGYRAFRVNEQGKPADRLQTFDAAAREIILMPQLVGG
jgi:hypothetical protein